MASRFQINKYVLVIAYKLLNDILLGGIIFFGLALVADGMVPGIVTGHVSFLKIIIFMFFTLLAAYILGSFLNIEFGGQKTNKKTAAFLAAFSALIIFNSLYKLNVILALFIMALTVISGYFIYKNILENN